MKEYRSITSPEVPRDFLPEGYLKACKNSVKNIMKQYAVLPGYNEGILNEILGDIDEVSNDLGKHCLFTSDQYFTASGKFVYAVITTVASESGQSYLKLFQVVCGGENRLKLSESKQVVIYT